MNMIWNIVFVYLWTVFVIPAEFRKLCPASVQTPIRIKDPDDCTKYHLCVDMREFIVTCPEHYVVNERSLKCVPEGSVFDTCPAEEKWRRDLCLRYPNITLQHPYNCAKYLVCDPAAPKGSMARIEECDFPYLYSPVSGRCKHYSVVQCGQRFQPKSHCEYDKYLCKHAHCPPCFLRHPSCHGLPEGLNPWPGREGTPFFLVCREGRVRYSGQCPDTPTSHQVFDPYRNICVEKHPKDNSD
ncbi:uncharacterized protein LOC111109921 [Crassostrea virginica]|uniref:Uncharacterized protein LOC111109921 n=1 Tax=Crassostrea virginica TaxID=6565 RepID=A0A8B8BFU6_CRAVI|nr:uncharacterized protein LOC111109921 [Crassostrea virginica]